PQDSIKRALRHLNRLIVYRSYKYSKAYAYFVLALAGESHSSKIRKDIKRLRNRPGNYYRRNEELFLMGAALYLSGHKSEGLELINEFIDDFPEYRRYNDSTYYSTLRYMAMKLYVLEMIDPGAERQKKYESKIASRLDRRVSSSFFTTQELAWSTMALGKRIKNLNIEEVKKAVLNADGRKMKFDKTSNGHIINAEGLSAFENLDIEVDSDSFAFISISGYPVEFTRDQDYSGIKLEVNSRNIEGGLKSFENGYSLGDLGIIEVNVENLTPSRQENTAVVVRIPSGFEIENPRLKGDHKPAWVPEEQWEFDHMDIRDDRIEVFGTLDSREKASFYFAVRANFSGSFQMPGPSAEVMYLPEYFYYGNMRNVKVK
ncbi:MAG: hypothetical protein ACQESB_07680, partial [Elusimicrobiota bacterium]